MVMPNGLLTVKVIGKHFNSENYMKVLKSFALPIMKLNYKDIVFVQDNSSIHTSKKLQTFFKDENLKVLQWPSKSPDINIIENIWKMLSDEVYSGTQPRNVKQLEELLFKSVNKINQFERGTIRNMYSTFRKRITKVFIVKEEIINS